MIFLDVGVVDGEFFPRLPAEMLAAGEHKKNFNLLASTVEDELSLMFYMYRNDDRFRRTNPVTITLEEAQNFLTELIHNETAYSPNQVSEQSFDAIRRLYFNG